jgi:hypothetical protein
LAASIAPADMASLQAAKHACRQAFEWPCPLL